MNKQCQTEGFYRIKITEYGLREADSGAVAISLKAELLEAFIDGEWVNWGHAEEEADGDIWIVKKDGKCNDMAVESLAKFTGWDGDVESILNATWQPLQCQCQIKREEYKGVPRFRISFLNSWQRTPGMMGNVTTARAKELSEKFGRGLRSIAGQHIAPEAHDPLPTPVHSHDDIPF